MPLTKHSCWHACPFDADLVLRKTGARRTGDPRLPLSLIGLLAQERGHRVQLLKRVARFNENDIAPINGSGYVGSREQNYHALLINGQFFSMCGANSWEELLLHAHGCMLSSSMDNTPSRYQETGWLTQVYEQNLATVERKWLYQARALKVDERRPTVFHGHPLTRMFQRKPMLPKSKPAVQFSAGDHNPMDFWASIAHHLINRGVDCEVIRSKLTYDLPRPKQQALANEQWQIVRTTYTLNAGPMVFYGADDDYPSISVRSSRNILARAEPLSERIEPKYFFTPNEAGQAWRLIKEHLLENQLPSAFPEASARPKARM